MEVDFEILIVLNTAVLFTIIYIISKGYKPIAKLGMIFSLLSAICWFVLGLGFVATNPTFPPFAYLFLAAGLLFTVFSIMDTLSLLKEKPDKDWYKRD